MSIELSLVFPDKEHVSVHFDGNESGVLAFTNPLRATDGKDIQWYLEVYGSHWSDEPDDIDARRIEARLPVWGKALFDAVFSDSAAARLFNSFQDKRKEARLLTIRAEDAAILSIPWELLHDSKKGGVFLFHETPRISIRRGVPGATGGVPAFKVTPRERLHLLFVVSRPEDAGFLDPRADAGAVLDALDQHAAGRFTWEFLRPATIDALVDRLEDDKQTPVDILHFDGHGVFDRESDADMGYLLFEKPDGTSKSVSAKQLGDNLHRHNVPLIILSACQTAAHGEHYDPMSSVAARLTAAGIPAVLAMTHSVLVPTTQMLFGQFYKDLARGRGVGEALDDARRYLVNNPEKYEVQRGPKRIWLELHDWFLPALYQSGEDVPLLKKLKKDKKQEAEAPQPYTNLPKPPESGFFGRRRELRKIEKWFSDKTRRITITGFGGQGKTALAEEAGRWLVRTGMFQKAVILRYNQIPSTDALGVAVSNIGSAVGVTISGAENAGAVREGLEKTATLVILDNLEALADEPLKELLDAAVGWSEAASSRVLCTTRKPDFGHEHYRVEGSLIHQRIVLSGLGNRDAPGDALEWYTHLIKLPPAPRVPQPKRNELIALFDKVKFHPLSIRVLAQQLKTRRPTELGPRLEYLLAARRTAASSAATDATLPELVASLQLSLDRLDETARPMLSRLGVFQGGSWEPVLLEITDIPKEVWPALRQELESAALIEAEKLPGIKSPFLRFHPTLAPMLWEQLSQDEQGELGAAYRQQYYDLTNYLYREDVKNPHEARSIAWRELPNILHAVQAALDEADADAVDFADSVNCFLDSFGLKQDSEALLAKVQVAAREVGSRPWYLAHSAVGEQLRNQGRVAEAEKVFQAVLEGLGPEPSYERASTLARLGRCLMASGRPDMAAQFYQDSISVLDQLDQTDAVKRHRGIFMIDLADVLTDQGRYAEARKAYEDGLEIVEKLDDFRAQGVTLGQLGTLAMLEGKLEEAIERYRAALSLFQQLSEPGTESIVWHQLGVVFQEAGDWEEAERHYREAARICEELGMISGPNSASSTWHQLARVNQEAGKPEAAEMWYRKDIDICRSVGDKFGLSKTLNNLAGLLLTLPGRLTEARELAEEALAIKQTLDPGAVEIWTTYGILAEIAEKEAASTSDSHAKAELQTQAREYRRLAREALFNFAGTRQGLREHADLIIGTVLATQQPEVRTQLEELLPDLEQRGWTNLVAAIRSIVAGERDAEVLCGKLDLEDSMIVEAILQGLDNPSSLEDLLPDEEQDEQDSTF